VVHFLGWDLRVELLVLICFIVPSVQFSQGGEGQNSARKLLFINLDERRFTALIVFQLYNKPASLVIFFLLRFGLGNISTVLPLGVFLSCCVSNSAVEFRC